MQNSYGKKSNTQLLTPESSKHIENKKKKISVFSRQTKETFQKIATNEYNSNPLHKYTRVNVDVGKKKQLEHLLGPDISIPKKEHLNLYLSFLSTKNKCIVKSLDFGFGDRKIFGVGTSGEILTWNSCTCNLEQNKNLREALEAETKNPQIRPTPEDEKDSDTEKVSVLTSVKHSKSYGYTLIGDSKGALYFLNSQFKTEKVNLQASNVAVDSSTATTNSSINELSILPGDEKAVLACSDSKVLVADLGKEKVLTGFFPSLVSEGFDNRGTGRAVDPSHEVLSPMRTLGDLSKKKDGFSDHNGSYSQKPTEEESQPSNKNYQCLCCASHASLPIIAVGLSEGTIQLYDPREKAFLFELPRHTHKVNSLDFSSRYALYSASSDFSACLTDIRMPKIPVVTYDTQGKESMSIKLNPANEEVLAIGNTMGGISFYKVQNKEPFFHNVFAHDNSINALQWSSNGEMLVSSGNDYCTKLWGAAYKNKRYDLEYRGLEFKDLAELSKEVIEQLKYEYDGLDRATSMALYEKIEEEFGDTWLLTRKMKKYLVDKYSERKVSTLVEGDEWFREVFSKSNK